MIFPLIFGLQLIALSPAMKHVETVNGWDIARSDNGCVAEMAESNGTYVAFQVNVDGTNSITLSNPAWRSLKSEPLTISMRFQRLLYKGPIIADSEEDAVGTQATSSRGVLRLIGIPVEKEDLDFLMKNTSSRVRMGFFKGETMLTNWFYMHSETYTHLRSCIDDPFAR